jgi:hypothetical protein
VRERRLRDTKRIEERGAGGIGKVEEVGIVELLLTRGTGDSAN